MRPFPSRRVSTIINCFRLKPQNMPTVRLKARKAQPFYSHHPWVLDTAIAQVDSSAVDGEVVDLVNDKGDWIARGIFNSHSRIRVRLYTWQPDEALDDEFWGQRLEDAVSLRRQLGLLQPRSAERIVFSEADRLSGLIVDRFGEHLVIQVNALGIEHRLELIGDLLQQRFQPASISVRIDEATRRKERIESASRVLRGSPPDRVYFIEEHGLQFGVELRSGQKTGFYLDQARNRRDVARYMRGRTTLDMCCYSGGFSLAALALGGAKDCLGIDTSEHAVALARANAELNGITQAHFECGDMFTSLERLGKQGRSFGAVILDPPKFAHGRTKLQQALKAYHHLNRLALSLLERDGILVTCSCSGSVSREDFASMLFGVATRCKRDLQLLARFGASADHPTLISCPETEYLKCFVYRVL